MLGMCYILCIVSSICTWRVSDPQKNNWVGFGLFWVVLAHGFPTHGFLILG
jgi:hypothetical protein